MISSHARASTLPGSMTGFTLVELLVVIAIISILAGLSMVGIQAMRKNAQSNFVKAQISMLQSRIEAFCNEWGDYPPTSLSFYGVKGKNPVNEGNEALFVSLFGAKHNGPFVDDLEEDRWKNTDSDKLSDSQMKKVKSELRYARKTDNLLEYVDFWGNPYIYIHHRDYGTKFQYQTQDGKLFTVEAQKNKVTGEYAAPMSFQLWSVGEDEANQNGDGDDVCSWKS